jgi:hypothetical protein
MSDEKVSIELVGARLLALTAEVRVLTSDRQSSKAV